MTGLEKIIDEIISLGNAEAEAVKADASRQADEIISKKKEELATLEASKKAFIDADAAKREKQIASSATTKQHQEVLGAKQNIISSMLDEAYARFCSLEGDEYLAVIKKLFAQNAGEGTYILKLCAGDGEATLNVIKSEADSKGITIEMSDEVAIGNRGFILCQAGIEQNCTFDALYKANKAELISKACDILF